MLVGRYRFENVAHAYGPEEKPAPIIPKLAIEPRERIAILGRVGAGIGVTSARWTRWQVSGSCKGQHLDDRRSP